MYKVEKVHAHIRIVHNLPRKKIMDRKKLNLKRSITLPNKGENVLFLKFSCVIFNSSSIA